MAPRSWDPDTAVGARGSYHPAMADTQTAVASGFEALAAGDWPAARDRFVEACTAAETPEALLGLANACYWLGDLEVMLDSLERAYRAARAGGPPALAAAAAMSLVGYHKQFVGNMAAARGWLARAGRIVEAEAPELRGELCGARCFVTDDPVQSERFAREALAVGRDTGNPDLELLAMTGLGSALVQQGRTAEGMALLDEAMAAALGGECGDPLTAAARTIPDLAAMFEMMQADHDAAQGAGHWRTVVELTFARVSRPSGYTIADLARLDVPTLILCGDRSPFCTLEDGLAAYRALPGGELGVLPQTGHEITAAAVAATIEFAARHLDGR